MPKEKTLSESLALVRVEFTPKLNIWSRLKRRFKHDNLQIIDVEKDDYIPLKSILPKDQVGFYGWNTDDVTYWPLYTKKGIEWRAFPNKKDENK